MFDFLLEPAKLFIQGGIEKFQLNKDYRIKDVKSRLGYLKYLFAVSKTELFAEKEKYKK